MVAKILDGKSVAATIRSELAERCAAWVASGNSAPCLAAVLVGDNPASQVYVRNKQQACAKAGLESRLFKLSADDGVDRLLMLLRKLNEDPSVHGILVQLPLPKGYDERLILDAIDPLKDVDAFAPENVGLMFQERSRFLPCTPHGVMQLLRRYDISVEGKHAVVVGRSEIVGKPMASLLAAKEGVCGPKYSNATVTLAHSRTSNLDALLREADIVVAAIGRPEQITGSMLKPGCVVIDVGINRAGDKLVGDVHFESASSVAEWITPVPGGVGPLTIAMLLENTLRAAQLQKAN